MMMMVSTISIFEDDPRASAWSGAGDQSLTSICICIMLYLYYVVFAFVWSVCMKRLKEKIGGERAKWYVIWSKWIPRIVLPSSHLQHQSHSSLSVTRLHCICICVCICIFQSLSLAVQGVSWTNGVLSTLWFYWLPIIIHYNSPESVSAIKQICEADILQYRYCHALHLSIPFQTQTRFAYFFSGHKMFEKRFYCKWLKVSKIIVTDSLCHILSMSLPICQFHCLSVCQVSKKY